MLLNFTVGNWMSYRDEATISMIASRERQHSDTLAKLPGFRSKKALPIAAVYGGNASGKTGLFKGLSALRRMVVSDPGVDGVLPVDAFKLDDAYAAKPTVFDVTFLAGEHVYRYMVEATLREITYECLERIGERSSFDLFERELHEEGYRYKHHASLGDPGYLSYVSKATRKNQTFLGNAVAQNVDPLDEAYRWFAETLELVGVGSNAWSFATAAENREGFLEYAGSALSRLDTGIVGLAGERVDESFLPNDAQFLKNVRELKKGTVLTAVLEKAAGDYGFEMLTVHADDDGLRVERMRSLHEESDGKPRSFGLGMESSGTQRLMGLLPMLFDLQNSNGAPQSKVYVVDELDRCLHTMLTARLIKDFLSSCGPDTRKQLLFTTHDLLMMDQSFMRRDEMYVSQRGTDGCSELVGLSEFKDIRYDKDLIRSYLDGRFGGIPMLGETVAHGKTEE